MTRVATILSLHRILTDFRANQAGAEVVVGAEPEVVAAAGPEVVAAAVAEVAAAVPEAASVEIDPASGPP